MIELLFVAAFAFVLVFTGVSIAGVCLAVAVGFVVMALAGMVGMVLKLLPWLLLIAIVVWAYRRNQGGTCQRRFSRQRRFRDSDRY